MRCAERGCKGLRESTDWFGLVRRGVRVSPGGARRYCMNLPHLQRVRPALFIQNRCFRQERVVRTGSDWFGLVRTGSDWFGLARVVAC
jgi:hypothetical protein